MYRATGHPVRSASPPGDSDGLGLIHTPAATEFWSNQGVKMLKYNACRNGNPSCKLTIHRMSIVGGGGLGGSHGRCTTLLPFFT